MTGLQLLVLVIVAIVTAIILAPRNRFRKMRGILDRLRPRAQEKRIAASEPRAMSEEEESKAEYVRLQKIIEDRKQIAWDTDISHHLWNLYSDHFRSVAAESRDDSDQDGEWYQVSILRASSDNGLNEIVFELKGARYRFVDDEEKRGWSDNLKYFSLFLYDDADRCLIEIPMRIRVDSLGRMYSVSSGGPNAFLPGDWIKHFIDVTLKNQSIRKQEIRAQKHQERLAEIRELKARFGISD